MFKQAIILLWHSAFQLCMLNAIDDGPKFVWVSHRSSGIRNGLEDTPLSFERYGSIIRLQDSSLLSGKSIRTLERWDRETIVVARGNAELSDVVLQIRANEPFTLNGVSKGSWERRPVLFTAHGNNGCELWLEKTLVVSGDRSISDVSRTTTNESEPSDLRSTVDATPYRSIERIVYTSAGRFQLDICDRVCDLYADAATAVIGIQLGPQSCLIKFSNGRTSSIVELPPINGFSPQAMASSRDGRRVALLLLDNEDLFRAVFYLLEIDGNQVSARQLEVPGRASSNNGLAFGPGDDQFLLSRFWGSTAEVVLVDFETARILCSLIHDVSAGQKPASETVENIRALTPIFNEKDIVLDVQTSIDGVFRD